MKTVQDVSTVFRHELAALYDAREIDSLSINVLVDCTGMSTAKIKAFPELEIPLEQAEIINRILDRLKTGEPLQYILGHTEFYGLPFKVNSSVLIPRPETEELVEWVLNNCPSSVGSLQRPINLLDIGTGSGCIAISLKKNLPDAKVSAIDISPKALQTAKENTLLNVVEIYFIEADILKPQSEIEHSTFEIIISNPPYVTLEDKKQMHTNVIDFEPHNALFVPKHDPLIFYKAIADFAAIHLENDGLLFFEINESYGKEIVDLLTIKSFKNIELRKDMSGRDRMIRAFYRSG